MEKWPGGLTVPFFHQESAQQEETRRKEQEALEKQKKLFEGLRFFLNREVPRESLAFVIRYMRDHFAVGEDQSLPPSFQLFQFPISSAIQGRVPCLTHAAQQPCTLSFQ